MAEEKNTNHGAEKKGKKAGRLNWIGYLVLVLGVFSVVGALFCTGVFDSLFSKPETFSYYTYDVNNTETLTRYLEHSSLRPGDTLNATSPITLDVDEVFGGYKELPLVNWTGSDVTFRNGTLVFLGGVSKEADMTPVRFSGTKVLIDAPSTDLTMPNLPGDDKQINVATLNGSEHLVELDLKAPGTIFTVPVTLKNETSGGLTGVPVQLSGANYIFVDGDQVTVDLEAGASTTLDLKVIATQGGRAKVTACAYDEAGKQLVSGGSDYQVISGAGYFAGEPHTETSASGGGKRGSVSDIITKAYNSGLSWVGYAELEVDNEEVTEGEVDSLTHSHGDFLFITGKQTGEGFGTHHLLAYNTTAHPRSDYGEWVDDHGFWVLQDAVQEFIDDGGIVILPDFFRIGQLTDCIAKCRSLRDETALEVLYGHLELDSMEYKVVMNVWNNINVRGYQKLYALGSSYYVDPSETIGLAYTKGYMTDLSEEAFYEMLKSGNYFVSNGPEVYFTLGSTVQGSELNVSAGDKALLKISAFDDVPLKSVTVLRYIITGNMDNEIKEEVYTKDLTGQNITSWQDSVLLDMNGEQDCFYRVEVRSEKSISGAEEGRAFSNPIWTYVSDKSGNALFHEITVAENVELHQSSDGTYYVVGSKLNSESVQVTAGEEAMVLVDYHKVTGSNFASYYTVRIIAPDGTVHIEKIYAIDTYQPKKK